MLLKYGINKIVLGGMTSMSSTDSSADRNTSKHSRQHSEMCSFPIELYVFTSFDSWNKQHLFP